MKQIHKAIISLAVLGLLICSLPVALFFIPFWAKSVHTYEEGVKIKWGKIQEQKIEEGLIFYNPISTDIRIVDMRERTTTIDTSTVSKEGLKFGVKLTVRYQVKDGLELVSTLQTELHDLINTYANATIDDVATGKDKNEMYSDTGRVETVKAVKDKLNTELDRYAIITQVIFEDITLPESITNAIQAQQAELEKIKQKENEKQVAEKQAEIRVIEAQGVADSNRIIQDSLTKEYLQYEAIQKFNPTAEKIYIPSDAMTPVIGY